MADVPPEFQHLCKVDAVSPKEPDDPLDFRFWLTPPSENADATVAVAEHEVLVNALLGETPSPAASAPATKVSPITAAPVFVAPALVKFANRVGEIERRAPTRQEEIAAILDKAKAKLGGPRDQECWDRLAGSCENFVISALLEV
jgi:hypothetical protein